MVKKEPNALGFSELNPVFFQAIDIELPYALYQNRRTRDITWFYICSH